ncbi:carbon monoxide dehydrogenase [Actinosynnema sp. ALI-1.44]|uniref:FAD binding domain-containing protein n=1 Tax=Actinosynnema sp. ALI-1.44 TaxID=1933779 RepID=UPI00097CB998|nr:xanthine dehydrogenase family protein subunit M [Actinosynnema sp. ALI-1.44]ONI77981.1 carbon monoxide dehydrogenase [Actinosynnema sp. ALI-1.44]
MIPAPFDYRRPGSVAEALELLASPGAALLAGGHSLLPLMKLRVVSPDVLVDVGALAELRYVRLDGDTVEIGALTRFCDLVVDPVIREHAPLLARAASSVGDRQVRHRGTIGGSLAHADPAADVPAAVLACGGVVMVHGPDGARRVHTRDFFLGRCRTALGLGEMIVSVRVPRQTHWGFEKFTRRALEWALVGVAVAGESVVLINMGDRPVRAGVTEAALRQGASIEQAAGLAAWNTDPVDEPHASAGFRQHLARVLTRRALQRAAGRVPGGLS